MKKEDKQIDKNDPNEKEKVKMTDEADIDIFKRYGKGLYSEKLKSMEDQVKKMSKDINVLCGIRESETGLALPSNWVIEQDKQALGEDSLMVGRITKILEKNTDHSRYIVHIRQMAKYVVDLHENLSPTDVEEGMRIGVEKKKYKISLPLPPKIDPSVSLMTVEERPDVSYDDIGGYKEQIDKLKV